MLKKLFNAYLAKINITPLHIENMTLEEIEYFIKTPFFNERHIEAFNIALMKYWNKECDYYGVPRITINNSISRVNGKFSDLMMNLDISREYVKTTNRIESIVRYCYFDLQYIRNYCESEEEDILLDKRKVIINLSDKEWYEYLTTSNISLVCRHLEKLFKDDPIMIKISEVMDKYYKLNVDSIELSVKLYEVFEERR